jgi:hypothetical protein
MPSATRAVASGILRGRFRRLAALGVVLQPLAACPPPPPPGCDGLIGPRDQPSVRSVSTSTTQLRLRVGAADGSVTASVVQPAGAPAATVSWTSDAPAVATVRGSGAQAVVSPAAEGRARVSATASAGGGECFAAGSATAVVDVEVLPRAVSSVQVTTTRPTVSVGEDVPLAAIVRDAQGGVLGGRVVEWSVTPVSGVLQLPAAGASVVARAVGAGEADVVARAEGVASPPTRVVVQAPAALTEFTLAPAALAVTVGRTASSQATVRLGGPSVAVRYELGGPVPPVVSATVSAQGLVQVTGMQAGTGELLVRAIGSGAGFRETALTQRLPVTVAAAPPALSALRLSVADTVDLVVGQTLAFTAQPTFGGPGAAIVAYTVGTSDVAVARGSMATTGAGVLTALGAGVATITVQGTADGPGLTANTLSVRFVARVRR